MTAVLPETLAPQLRAAAERLLVECRGSVVDAPPEPEPPRPQRKHCHHCKRRGGKMSGHHVSPTRVVWVHPGCHRKLHRRHRADGWCSA